MYSNFNCFVEISYYKELPGQDKNEQRIKPNSLKFNGGYVDELNPRIGSCGIVNGVPIIPRLAILVPRLINADAVRNILDSLDKLQYQPFGLMPSNVTM